MRTRPLSPLVLGSSLVIVAALSAAPARADDEPTSADIAAARALGQEGVKLADAGNCHDAVDKLARAEKLYHAPTTLARLGECQVQIGRLVDGTESLNRVIREPLGPNAPPAFAAAQERAKKIVAEAKPKIAKLKIAVAGPSDVTWAVKVDGESMPLANLNMNRPMDPGEHVIEATAPGYKVARAKVTLAEGGTDSVALNLERDPNAPVPPPAAAPGAQPAGGDSYPRGDDNGSGSRVAGYVTLGVGLVGVGVGSIFGVLALSKKNELDDNCRSGSCPSTQRDTLDSGETFGTVSTVGFIVGAVGIVAGTYLLLTSGGRGSRATTAPHTATTKPGVRPFIGVQTAGLVF